MENDRMGQDKEISISNEDEPVIDLNVPNKLHQSLEMSRALASTI
jgi:hypothetical protein